MEPHLWRPLPLHRDIRRRLRAATRRRGSARAEPRQHVLPARPGAVLVGAICPAASCVRVSPSLSPAGGPGSSGCFPALLFTVGLQLHVFPRVPFLVCDLACLVCTVQIKVVSLSHGHYTVVMGKRATCLAQGVREEGRGHGVQRQNNKHISNGSKRRLKRGP